MPLERQVITMPLAQGVDTKTDSKQVVAGKLLELENGIFTKLKAIQKRNGYRALGQNITNGPPPPGPQPVPSSNAQLWYRLNDGPLVAEARNSGTLSPYPSPDGTLTVVSDPTKVSWSADMPGLPWASPCLRILDRDVLLSGAATLDPLNNTTCSISLWFYGDGNAFPGEYTFLVKRFDYTGSYQFRIGWLDNLSDNLSAQIKTFSGPVQMVTSVGNYTRADFDGKYSFIVLTYDGVNMKLWVNGSEVGSYPQTDGILYTGYDLTIGRNDNGGGTNRTAIGYYSDFRVSSSVLSQLEIETMWNIGSGAP